MNPPQAKIRKANKKDPKIEQNPLLAENVANIWWKQAFSSVGNRGVSAHEDFGRVTTSLFATVALNIFQFMPIKKFLHTKPILPFSIFKRLQYLFWVKSESTLGVCREFIFKRLQYLLWVKSESTLHYASSHVNRHFWSFLM